MRVTSATDSVFAAIYHNDPEIQPTWEYDDDKRFRSDWDAAYHNGTERPSLLGHPEADEMLRAGFYPGASSWHSENQRHEIGLNHFNGDDHVNWMHEARGEGARYVKNYKSLKEALDSWRDGVYGHYHVWPYGSADGEGFVQ